MSALTNYLRDRGINLPRSKHITNSIVNIGRKITGNRISAAVTRFEFLRTAAPNGRILEIGPFTNPTLRGPNVKYFDVLDRERLIERAEFLSFPSQHSVEIDYVSPTGDLGIVEDTFDYVFSSHCIEHQPDLIAHLSHVERLLERGGRYLAIIPDKRYCFDHFHPVSTTEEVFEAFSSKRKIHKKQKVADRVRLGTHNDPARHWAGDHGKIGDIKNDHSTAMGLEPISKNYDENGNIYVDTHAWQFTPSSFDEIVRSISGKVSLSIENIFDTPERCHEFCVSLKKN